MNNVIIKEIDDILSNGWVEHLTYDRDMAEKRGLIVLRWKQTGVAIPLPITISQEALDKGRLHFGELRRNIKKYIPTNIVNQHISDANAILRGANRRDMRRAIKDFNAWIQETGLSLEKMFGASTAEGFLVDVLLPNDIQPNSLHALQFLVEAKVEHLRNL